MQGLCCVTKQHRAVVIDAGDSDSIYSYVGSGQQNGVRSTGSTTKPENRGSPAGIVNTMTCRGFSEITCYHCEGSISCRCLFSGNRCRRFGWSGAFFHGLEIAYNLPIGEGEADPMSQSGHDPGNGVDDVNGFNSMIGRDLEHGCQPY